MPFPLPKPPKNMTNYDMLEEDKEFVMETFNELVSSVCVIECDKEDVHIISPLGVKATAEKKMLYLSLCHIYMNKHLTVPKYNYKDLQAFSEFAEPRGWLISLIINQIFIMWTSDILLSYWKYLGFAWTDRKQE